jgi:hypothetical protein
MISRLKKVSMRLDRPKLFGLLMEIEDGFNELAIKININLFLLNMHMVYMLKDCRNIEHFKSQS